MKPNREFDVIVGNDVVKFVAEVNRKLQVGWMLHGPTQVVESLSGWPHFYQSVMRFEGSNDTAAT